MLDLFDAYPWPGNVRELRNVGRARGAVLPGHPHHASTSCRRRCAAAPASAASRSAAPRPVLSLQQASEQAEIEAIRAALEASAGPPDRAAERLGISRKTLWEKIKNYGIVVDPEPPATPPRRTLYSI